MMNCRRCHHDESAHARNPTDSRSGLGRCNIPQCTCRQYEDIAIIDDELL